MGRELQKRKKRSGIAKVRPQKQKKTKRQVLANAMLAENWDKNKTVSQNYAALGLTRRLNGPTGGIERQIPSDDPTAPKNKDSLAIDPSPRLEIPTQEARIERDSVTGAILRVLDDGSLHSDKPNTGAHRALHDPLNALEASEGGAPVASAALASMNPGLPASKRRTQSAREEEWIQRLIERHGVSQEDGSFDAMARDAELNVRQQSAGDLRRRVKKYLASAG